MIKYFLSFWAIKFSTQKEEWTGDDVAYRDAFVSSHLALTIEKSLRNRIAERNDTALSFVGEKKGELAKARMEELQDILLEWKNRRDDLQKKNAK